MGSPAAADAPETRSLNAMRGIGVRREALLSLDSQYFAMQSDVASPIASREINASLARCAGT